MPNYIAHQQQIDAEENRRLIYSCPNCKMNDSIVITNEVWKQMLTDWQNYRANQGKIDESTVPYTFNEKLSRKIGGIVASFRIDLDAVRTIEDLELFWNSQDRAEIPRESDSTCSCRSCAASRVFKVDD